MLAEAVSFPDIAAGARLLSWNHSGKREHGLRERFCLHFLHVSEKKSHQKTSPFAQRHKGVKVVNKHTKFITQLYLISVLLLLWPLLYSVI